MPALVAGIHALAASMTKAWMAGTSPAMTIEGSGQSASYFFCFFTCGAPVTPGLNEGGSLAGKLKSEVDGNLVLFALDALALGALVVLRFFHCIAPIFTGLGPFDDENG